MFEFFVARRYLRAKRKQVVISVITVISIIGVSAGVMSELNLLALMGKRGRILGSTMRTRPLEEKALWARDLEREVLPLFESGALHVPVADTFPLAAAAQAYDRFAAGGKFGKVVLVNEAG